MASLNSLLFLFSTIAPNTEPPVTDSPQYWFQRSVDNYGQKVPGLNLFACHVGEYPSCKSHCQKNCTNHDQDIDCPDICVFGCVCVEPLIRGPRGFCIVPRECPVTLDAPATKGKSYQSDDIQCPPDEKLSSFAHCQRNCTNVGQIIVCPGEGPRGCVCKHPMVRGPLGNCIMPKECPVTERQPKAVIYSALDEPACRLGEYPSCKSHCQRNCTNYDQDIPCPDNCVYDCVCVEPFIRGPDGSCIMPNECPATPNIPDTPEEVSDASCQGDCDYGVEEGMENEIKLKSLAGPFDNFKICEDENEVYKVCSSQCPDNCENYNDKRRACKLICLPLPKCECKEGFVRGPGGKCIAPEQCPIKEVSNEICPENEEYKECGTACQKNCDDYDKHIPCEFKCESGCFCKEPLIRGPSGRCIRPEQCPARSNSPAQSSKNARLGFLPDLPKLSCKENEVFSVWAPVCPDDCTNYKEDRMCKRISVPACKCIDGYVKGEDGNCIKKEDCEKMRK